ncbi:hypothetical protein [Ancylobacter amanitiformis]|uniref:Uncharacterized protein n=1 Tax=Ancylobacter amanitiformis TaxID=217069 RepID=A0ABU0LPV3_9HYPH|nr:hypothetical protein [Ancylobacter amanitiformis]MDQ0510628.1 hypothetical protein [Ancylobacter amanitiformis]
MNDITTTATMPLPAAGERTFRDIELAEALGYKRPGDIRKLIKRHLPLLEAMGLVRHRGAPIVSGKGRVQTVTEYHLTKAQAAFIIAKADTPDADNALILISETFAMVSEGKLVAVDAAAQEELDAAAARAAERHRLMREEKDDYSRIMREFSRSPSRNVIGTKPDGTPILREPTPFEKQREERKRLQQQASRAAKHRAPGDPTY